jgi:signal transduction histidine kinase
MSHRFVRSASHAVWSAVGGAAANRIRKRSTMDQATRGVLTVARSVLEQLDIDQVLDRVLDAARELTGARYAALGVLDESRNELARFLTRGIDEAQRRAIGPLPTGRGVLGELIRHPKPLRMADVGSHPYSYGFPVGHPPMSSFLGVPIVIRGEPFGNLYLTEKQGGTEFTEEDEEAAVLLADFAGVAIDHASRFTSSELQRAQLQRTVDALDATLQIARAVGGETDLDSILSLVAKRGRALVSARVLVIELLHGDELEMAAAAGELPAGVLGQRVPLNDTMASAALRAGRTQRLSDQLMRARFEQHGAGHLGVSAAHGLVVPLVFRNRRYGVLVALDHLEHGDFTPEHQNLLEAFAASAATAVATAQSAADEQRRQRVAAAEAERGRWARELHDETLQALGSLRLTLSSSRRSGDPEVLVAAVEQALEQLDLDITTLRALITELRPAALDQLGLEPALQALIDRTRRGGVDVECDVQLPHGGGNAPDRLSPDLETGVYRIVQEALTNAGKHGAAARATVSVIEQDEQLHVTVRDDGHGFDHTAATAGFGLAGMRERVELLGGELGLSSVIGEGTTVTATLPIARPQPSATHAIAPSAASSP